jgi:hypothetical protein
MDKCFTVLVGIFVTGSSDLAAVYSIAKNCLGLAVGCNGVVRSRAGDALANASLLIFLQSKAPLIALR